MFSKFEKSKYTIANLRSVIQDEPFSHPSKDFHPLSNILDRASFEDPLVLARLAIKASMVVATGHKGNLR